MSILTRFVESQLQRVELAEPGEFQLPPEKTMEIVRIAQPSIASSAGLAVGDRLLLVNGRPSVNVDLDRLLQPDRELVLLFERASGSERLEIRSKGASMGMQLERTQPALDDRDFDPLTEHERLAEIWERGEWKALAEECERRLQLKFADRLARLVSRKTTEDSPASLLQAVANYELGDRAKGQATIEKLRERHEKRWPTQCRAIAHYYEARTLLKSREQRQAEKILREAAELWPSSRIMQLHAEINNKRSGRRVDWLNKVFPEKYTLAGIGKAGDISLVQTLKSMKSTQLLLVVLMGGFRSNSDYSEFVRRYLHWKVYFPSFVSEMHVITTTRDRAVGVSTPEHLQAEERAVRRNFPIRVLWDREQVITDRLQPNASPTPLFLNHEGRILHIGCPDDVEWWELLNQVTT